MNYRSDLSAGIDFGTSNSLAAVCDGNRVELCPLDPHNSDPHLLPSLLYFSRYGWKRIGRQAVSASHTDLDGRFIRSLKASLPECTPEDRFRIIQTLYTLPQLVGLVFERIAERIVERWGALPARVTIGRPVRFSVNPDVDAACQGMLHEAAERGGFRGISFLTEPEAAARYHFSLGGFEDVRHAMVFDFGGGTLDLSVARVSPDGSHRILSTAGAAIGGSLLDRIIFEGKLLHHLGSGRKWGQNRDLPHSLFNRLINPDENWRISDSEYAREISEIVRASVACRTESRELRQLQEVVSRRLGPSLFQSVEASKLELSRVAETEIAFDADRVRIREKMDRGDLFSLLTPQMDEIRVLIQQVLDRAGIERGEINRVLLAGGSSGLLCTQELLQELFGSERVPMRQDLFTSIASGLALHSAMTPAGAA